MAMLARTKLGALSILTFSILGPAGVAARQAQEPLPSIESKTEGMQKLDGFLPVYWDPSGGKVWLEVARWGEEILYYPSLPAGLGQNDIGLNRGDLGGGHVVAFQRVGPKILMQEPNYRYRAVSDEATERRSVEDGFPTSILWGFTAAAETGDRVLVDATDFFLRDAHGVIRTLGGTGQGTYRLEASRSAIYLPRTRAFPQNTEVEVTLTFTSDQPGGLVRSVTPDAGSLTVREHHSFVQLPPLDGSYQPRQADPRAGYFGLSYMDFAQPIDMDLTKRFITRHRLIKRNPGLAPSEPVEPIVYYLDPGTPEPVRSALLEGGRMWNQAFTAAGFIDGFRMEILPDTADPMDARYNVVQWVHRSTRGWSYGNSIVDPRTGEILKGHVTLGSLRVRQDYLIGESLLSPYVTGDEDPTAISEMALQRIRQLSAHEIGHTLGLAHNFVSSSQKANGVQSVMDYPQPVITLENGVVHMGRDSYADEIGAWDKIAIRYGYSDFGAGADEHAELDAILQEGIRGGVTFLTDNDARPASSAHPNVHIWDNGASAALELQRMMDVRRVALDRFGQRAIRSGEPLATIEEALVPLFLYHRYQVQATSKVVAGQYYTYALRGDGQTPVRAVPASEQRQALDALVGTLAPSELTIPRSVLESLPPRPPLYGSSQELFRRQTGLVFDALAPAAAAADFTLEYLFDPDRTARMVEQKALDPSLPGLFDVIGRVRDGTFGAPAQDGYEAAVKRVVERAFVDHLMSLAGTAPMPQVRAEAQYGLRQIAEQLSRGMDGGNAADQAHEQMLVSDIGRFLERPHEPIASPRALDMPPGDPIGDPGMLWLKTSASGTPQVDLTCEWDLW